MSEQVALNSQVIPAEASAPDWIDLVPAGQVNGRDGRGWVNDAPDAIVAAFNSSGLDIPIDVEHATEIKAPQGEPAPAAGWIKELQAQNGAVRGRVEWTDAGRDLVSSKAYRYVSPVIVFERASDRIVKLTSVGLTNRPNLSLPALNRQLPEEKGNSMKNALVALGLPDSATEEQAVDRIAALKNDLATALNRADAPTLEKFVPRADHDAALSRAANAEQKLAEVQGQILETAINAEIDAALKAGKITPATVEYHKAQCRQEGGLDRFKAFCQAAPVVAADDAVGRDAKSCVSTALNTEEQYVCKAMGISETDFINAKKGA